MARTPQEMDRASSLSGDSEHVYPYNLCISLTQEDLEKLGLDCDDEACQSGNYVHLHALAEITGKFKADTKKGVEHTLNLQITHLEVEDEGAENKEADEGMAGAA